MQFWYVYVLRSLHDGQFYIGTTNNLKRRVAQHQNGENIYFDGHRSKADALRRERYFKTTKGKVTLRQMLRDALQQG